MYAETQSPNGASPKRPSTSPKRPTCHLCLYPCRPNVCRPNGLSAKRLANMPHGVVVTLYLNNSTSLLKLNTVRCSSCYYTTHCSRANYCKYSNNISISYFHRANQLTFSLYTNITHSITGTKIKRPRDIDKEVTGQLEDATGSRTCCF